MPATRTWRAVADRDPSRPDATGGELAVMLALALILALAAAMIWV
ncbi:MAG TPA: hypothetical protein VFG83_17830 [Kofleriaceae bacterium]|nr:hypothetical protein [Kofleriaceae bacterium]